MNETVTVVSKQLKGCKFDYLSVTWDFGLGVEGMILQGDNWNSQNQNSFEFSISPSMLVLE